MEYSSYRIYRFEFNQRARHPSRRLASGKDEARRRTETYADAAEDAGNDVI